MWQSIENVWTVYVLPIVWWLGSLVHTGDQPRWVLLFFFAFAVLLFGLVRAAQKRAERERKRAELAEVKVDSLSARLKQVLGEIESIADNLEAQLTQFDAALPAAEPVDVPEGPADVRPLAWAERMFVHASQFALKSQRQLMEKGAVGADPEVVRVRTFDDGGNLREWVADFREDTEPGELIAERKRAAS